MDEKLYVLIREDLSTQQQAVQAGHAVAEYLLRGPEHSWSNGTLVYLGVRDREIMERWITRLSDRYIPFVAFKEPDLNDEITALAVIAKERVFRSLRLIGSIA
jgi:hypothetical protein